MAWLVMLAIGLTASIVHAIPRGRAWVRNSVRGNTIALIFWLLVAAFGASLIPDIWKDTSSQGSSRLDEILVTAFYAGVPLIATLFKAKRLRTLFRSHVANKVV